MSFIPRSKNKFLSRWGFTLISIFPVCLGVVITQSTLQHWDQMSTRKASMQAREQITELTIESKTKEELAAIAQQAKISEVHQEKKILDYTCGTRLNNFKYNPGSVDQDLINWGIDATDPIYNPTPGNWYPLYGESGQLVAAVKNGQITSIDTEPAMDAGRMCSLGQLK